MRWEERLLDLFDDLEQQAEGLALAERDALVAEQSRSEYAAVALADRLHASVGTRLLLDVAGLGALDGRLVRAGDGWCLLDADREEWVVVTAAVRAVRGLADGGRAPDARPLTARLGLGSALRGLAGDRTEVLLHRVDGSTVTSTSTKSSPTRPSPAGQRRTSPGVERVSDLASASAYMRAMYFSSSTASMRYCWRPPIWM